MIFLLKRGLTKANKSEKSLKVRGVLPLFANYVGFVVVLWGECDLIIRGEIENI